jgi:hypothetical protein
MTQNLNFFTNLKLTNTGHYNVLIETKCLHDIQVRLALDFQRNFFFDFVRQTLGLTLLLPPSGQKIQISVTLFLNFREKNFFIMSSIIMRNDLENAMYLGVFFKDT